MTYNRLLLSVTALMMTSLFVQGNDLSPQSLKRLGTRDASSPSLKGLPKQSRPINPDNGLMYGSSRLQSEDVTSSIFGFLGYSDDYQKKG